jgi:drug/metabolite transporter (DMT)-like permease
MRPRPVKNGRDIRRGVRAIGWPDLIAIPIAAISIGSYVVALKLTTVANVMVVYATVPFVAAGIAYFWIGERIGSRFVLASAVALVGIVVMAGFATRPQDLVGNAVVLLMTLAFGAQIVMARRYPSLEMAPVNAAGAALCALFCWPFTAARLPNFHQLIVLALFGITTTSLAYVLFLTGGRHIPSGEAGLIGLLYVVLAPLWVWLVFSEHPGRAAIIGGALVLAPVLVERVAGTCLRRFTLPESAQAEAIKARYTDGVLEIAIPKQPRAEPKRITVTVN